MPVCPNGHSRKTGRICPDCGAELIADESVNIRSAKAMATTSPTFVLPGSQMETRHVLAKCPKRGQCKIETDAFDCQDDRKRHNLCLRHFDKEYEVCVDCAHILQGKETMTASAASQFDTYSGFEFLGEGGFGKVFIVREASLGRTVVIKELKPILRRLMPGCLEAVQRDDQYP